MKRLLGLIVGLIFALPSMAANLPAGYTELEYIEATGTQYIDTGIVMNDTTGIKIVIDDTATNSPQPAVAAYFVGAQSSSSYQGYFIRYRSSESSLESVWAWNGENVLGRNIQSNHSTVYINYMNDRKYTYNNGTNTYSRSGDLPTLANTTISTYLFAIHMRSGTAANYFVKGKIYSAQFTEGSTIVHSFVPARNSSGVIGMYDIMDSNSETAFHTNKGSGSFTGGNPVNPCKNLLHMTADNITMGKYIDGEGLDADGDSNFAYNKNITVNPNTDYTMSVSGPIYLIIGAFYDENNNMLSRIVPSDRNISLLTMRSPNNAKYFRFSANFNSGNSFTKAQVLALNWQLEAGSTATSYTPFNASCFCQENQAAYTYESATGTVTRNGTPTPTNPIEPVFYKQGNMVLRKIANYADSYDASTGKITRRVGVKIFDGTEALVIYSDNYIKSDAADVVFVVSDARQHNNSLSNAFVYNGASIWNLEGYPNKWVFNPMNDKMQLHVNIANDVLGITDYTQETQGSVIAKAKAFFKRMYDAGTPVTMYYPLKTEVEETWSELYCSLPIKIATTKYNTNAFSGVVTALSNAVTTIKTVVANTINQATAVANLQSGKQTMPNSTATNGTCPNYKQCLLVEDDNGTPHWYVITDPFRDFVAPIIATNTAPASTTNDAGYTQLESITGTSGATGPYIDTGVYLSSHHKVEFKAKNFGDFFGVRESSPSPTFGVTGGGVVDLFKDTSEISGGGRMNFTLTSNHDVVVYIENGHRYVYDTVTNTNISSSSYTTSAFTHTTYTAPIFRIAWSAPASTRSSSVGTLYYLKIWDGDTLVRDMIPVRQNSTGKYGLYDKVNNRFYGSVNTASDAVDFIPGPEVINQDPAIPGMRWTATWTSGNGVTAGTVSGVARCTSVAGTNNASSANPTKFSELSSAQQTEWNTPFTSSTVSGYSRCWCKMTGVSTGGENVDPMGANDWTFYISASETACRYACASGCAARVGDKTTFRNAILGQ